MSKNDLVAEISFRDSKGSGGGHPPFKQYQMHICTSQSTPPKFNIDTKNGGFGKRNSFQIRQFLVSMLNFRNVGLLPYISARTHSETAAGGLEDFMR